VVEACSCTGKDIYILSILYVFRFGVSPLSAYFLLPWLACQSLV
jgi:hypothetical protein